MYTDPDAEITIDLKNPPAKEGYYGTFYLGPCDLKEDVWSKQPADHSHRFWHGLENPIAGVTKGIVKQGGKVTAMLKLLPVIKPAFQLFPDGAEGDGAGKPDSIQKNNVSRKPAPTPWRVHEMPFNTSMTVGPYAWQYGKNRTDRSHGEQVESLNLPEETYRRFIGGSGLGAKMFWDRADFSADPLSPAALFILMNGPLAGIRLSGASRMSATARSPLTGGLADSSCGGYFAPALRLCRDLTAWSSREKRRSLP